MRIERAGSRPTNRKGAGALYRAACLATAAAMVFVACAIEPADDVGSARLAALPELPPDTFTDVILPTDPEGTGWTTGHGSVTEDGAAVFDIPLFLPAGRNGIRPELSLHYHSRQGDGLLGTGWSLSGLSMITRCARNELIDGVTRDVQFTTDDAFCLDGDRLVEPPTGGFWGGGEYRRWRNGFEKITRTGQPGDPASVFQVWKRDGTIWTYGGAPDGYISGPRVGVDPMTGGPTTPTTETYGWLLTRMEDRFGNYVEYHYQSVVHPDLMVEVVPDYIQYTGHPTLGPGQRRVEFDYATRAGLTWGKAAKVVQWISGFGLRTSQLLGAVTVTALARPGSYDHII